MWRFQTVTANCHVKSSFSRKMVKTRYIRSGKNSPSRIRRKETSKLIHVKNTKKDASRYFKFYKSIYLSKSGSGSFKCSKETGEHCCKVTVSYRSCRAN